MSLQRCLVVFFLIGFKLPSFGFGPHVVATLEGIKNPGKDFVNLELTSDTIVIVEKMPEFPGGMKGMMKFLNRNIKYPKSARKDKVGGTVVVGFIITHEGKVDSVVVVQSVRKDLDDSAVNLIKKMPVWKPGTQDGKPVAVRYTMPLLFKP